MREKYLSVTHLSYSSLKVALGQYFINQSNSLFYNHVTEVQFRVSEDVDKSPYICNFYSQRKKYLDSKRRWFSVVVYIPRLLNDLRSDNAVAQSL